MSLMTEAKQYEARYPLRIYYDHSCPLCREEMSALKAYDRLDRLELVDCSPLAFADADADAAGYTRAQMMRLIHARDAGGRWLIGVPVFQAAYAAAGIHAVAATMGHPVLQRLWCRLYPWVADHRQPLSRLRLHRLYGWWVRRMAERALRRSRQCADGACELH